MARILNLSVIIFLLSCINSGSGAVVLGVAMTMGVGVHGQLRVMSRAELGREKWDFWGPLPKTDLVVFVLLQTDISLFSVSSAADT